MYIRVINRRLRVPSPGDPELISNLTHKKTRKPLAYLTTFNHIRVPMLTLYVIGSRYGGGYAVCLLLRPPSACLPAPYSPAQRPGNRRRISPLPCPSPTAAPPPAPKLFGHSAPARNRKPRDGTPDPPLAYMPGPGTTSKNSFISLLFSEGFRLEITPLPFFPKKIFKPKIRPG